MKTEQEARECWCPFVRYAYGAGKNSSGNRTDAADDKQRYNCIASDCMAWRWAEGSPSTDTYLASDGTQCQFPQFGFCGLAGKPE